MGFVYVFCLFLESIVLHNLVITPSKHRNVSVAFLKSESISDTVTSITLSFLSCLAYGKQGMTAVTRCADAILHALIIINSSIKLSLMSPQPLCTMKTSSPRTDSPISTLKSKSSLLWGTGVNKTWIRLDRTGLTKPGACFSKVPVALRDRNQNLKSKCKD